MSNETQILVRVKAFMDYWHPQIPRQLPEAARGEYNMLHDVLDKHFGKPEKAPPQAKKKAKKKVSKKK